MFIPYIFFFFCSIKKPAFNFRCFSHLFIFSKMALRALNACGAVPNWSKTFSKNIFSKIIFRARSKIILSSEKIFSERTDGVVKGIEKYLKNNSQKYFYRRERKNNFWAQKYFWESKSWFGRLRSGGKIFLKNNFSKIFLWSRK